MGQLTGSTYPLDELLRPTTHFLNFNYINLLKLNGAFPDLVAKILPVFTIYN